MFDFGLTGDSVTKSKGIADVLMYVFGLNTLQMSRKNFYKVCRVHVKP